MRCEACLWKFEKQRKKYIGFLWGQWGRKCTLCLDDQYSTLEWFNELKLNH
jgi:hypothetical protein